MTLNTRDWSFIGKGRFYLKEKGAAAGLFPLGNVSVVNIAATEDRKEQRNYQTSGGGTANAVSSIQGVTASLTLNDISPDNVALAMRGLVSLQASVTVTDEQHTAYHNAAIDLNKIIDPDQAYSVTTTDGVTTYVEGTDYELRKSVLFILATGAIGDGSEIHVDYTSKKSHKVEGMVAGSKEYEIVFDGLNEAQSDRAVKGRFHKVKFSPSQALSLIGDDFGELPLTLDILQDDSKTGAGVSKYFSIDYED